MRNGRLQPDEKLELVMESLQADNVKAFCIEKGIDRGYLYQLQREFKEGATEKWASRRVGRPPKKQEDAHAESVAKLSQRCQELEEQALRWRVQAELGYVVMDIFESAGLLEDKRIKKNLRLRIKRVLCQRPSTR